MSDLDELAAASRQTIHYRVPPMRSRQERPGKLARTTGLVITLSSIVPLVILVLANRNQESLGAIMLILFVSLLALGFIIFAIGRWQAD